MYRAYYGGGGSAVVPPLENDRWPNKQFATLDEALLWARAVVRHGRPSSRSRETTARN
jgi:hypothetical protein